jgi:hypothetical protein
MTVFLFLLYKARSQSVHELNACVQDRARSGDANMYEHGSAKPTKNANTCCGLRERTARSNPQGIICVVVLAT